MAHPVIITALKPSDLQLTEQSSLIRLIPEKILARLDARSQTFNKFKLV